MQLETYMIASHIYVSHICTIHIFRVQLRIVSASEAPRRKYHHAILALRALHTAIIIKVSMIYDSLAAFECRTTIRPPLPTNTNIY